MQITFEEAALHLSRWRDDKTVILAWHLSRDRKNSTLINCVVASFDDCLTLVDTEAGHASGSYTFEDCAWSYMEFKDINPPPDYLRELFSPDNPILVLAWRDLELVIMQPLPEH